MRPRRLGGPPWAVWGALPCRRCPCVGSFSARPGMLAALAPLLACPASLVSPNCQDVLRRLLESDARGEDAVKLEAQKLLNAFHINVLL